MVTDTNTFPTSANPSSAGVTGGLPADTGPAAGPSATSDDLMRRVVQGAHATIDRLADTAAPAVSRLQEGVHVAGDKLHAGAEHARELGDEWTESLRTTVREHPLASVAVALAAGVLIARLSSR
jgi:ElaB/YqjD/DUF883 family membrane-anchored ribosome-binding protein